MARTEGDCARVRRSMVAEPNVYIGGCCELCHGGNNTGTKHMTDVEFNMKQAYVCCVLKGAVERRPPTLPHLDLPNRVVVRAGDSFTREFRIEL